jgi:hypothetical protein
MNGAVIFAQQNKELDYIKLAVFAAERVKKYLNIPVSIITDAPGYLNNAFKDHVFDRVIELPTTNNDQGKVFFDGSLSKKHLPWKNQARNSVYNLTPYDRTLVIDSDYIISSPILKSAIDNGHEFQIYQKHLDLSPHRNNDNLVRLSPYSIPFYWATTFIFNKNPLMEDFFNLVEYIKINWGYFKTLYNFDSAIFRNDHAFSIAIHIMNGKTNGEFATELPGKMIFSSDKDLLISIDDANMRFLIEKKDYLGEYTLAKTSGLDVHILNKFSLDRFITGGSGV